jgi:nitrate reductase assembly molybdenum cofactor insertion protein NarJ
MASQNAGLRLLAQEVEKKLEDARTRGRTMLEHRKAYQALGMDCRGIGLP